MNREEMSLIHITDELAQKTAKLLHSFALRRPSEGVVYWFGIESSNKAVVTTLVVPDADTESGAVRTSVEANARAISVIIGTPLVYVGQAHSHPGAYVRHSHVDDECTFAQFEGVISIVVPWFGKNGLNINECGVYRHIGGGFQRVKNVEEHLVILPAFADLRQCTAMEE
jgi:hypothetical protein